MYFSPQPLPPGSIANVDFIPAQSILSMFRPQYWVQITSVLEAATPMGAGTTAKGCALAAG
jgi:hypothetical protein